MSREARKAKRDRQQQADQAGGLKVIGLFIECQRVGSVRRFPGGSRVELTECFACGRPLWISSTLKEEVVANGLVLVPHCPGLMEVPSQS